jgi:hypothetical protein
MPFVPIPNVAQVGLVFDYDGQRCMNVFHVEAAVPYTLSTLAPLAAVFLDWWDNNLKEFMPQTLSLVMVYAKAMDSQSAPALEITSGLPIAGTVTTQEQLPNNCTFAVKWATGLRGRSYRGRTFHIGLHNAMVEGNVLGSTWAGDFQDIYELLIDAVDTLSASLVVVSKWENHNARNTGLTTVITSVYVDPTIDSQRRRLPGRGA